MLLRIRSTLRIFERMFALAFIGCCIYAAQYGHLSYHASLGNQEELFAPPQQIAMNELHAQEATFEAKQATKKAPVPKEKPPVPAKVEHPAFGGL